MYLTAGKEEWKRSRPNQSPPYIQTVEYCCILWPTTNMEKEFFLNKFLSDPDHIISGLDHIISGPDHIISLCDSTIKALVLLCGLDQILCGPDRLLSGPD